METNMEMLAPHSDHSSSALRLEFYIALVPLLHCHHQWFQGFLDQELSRIMQPYDSVDHSLIQNIHFHQSNYLL